MEKAFGLYLEAARQNDPDAQFRVGKMYFEGKGTEENQEEGLTWFKVAASNGNKWAAEIIAKINGKVPPE
jgi:TPR repeat protein